MTELTEREAACTCGDLRVTLAGEPEFVSSCCCTRCQRRTGAFFGVTVYFRPEQMVARSGAETIYRRPSDEGGEARFHFCARCGSTLWWRLAGDDSVIGVAGGCFADPALPAPQRMVFTSTRHPFVRPPEGLPTFWDGAD